MLVNNRSKKYYRKRKPRIREREGEGGGGNKMEIGKLCWMGYYFMHSYVDLLIHLFQRRKASEIISNEIV